MSDIFDTIRFGAGKAKNGAVNLGKQVVDKTNGFVSLAKIKFAISEEKNKINEIYADIGRTVYDNYTKGDYVEEDISEFCENIDKHSEELMTLQKRAEEAGGGIKCHECGENNRKDSSFCSKCGTPIKSTGYSEQHTSEDEGVF